MYRRGDNLNVNLLNALNVEKEMSDCPEIVEKFKNEEYGLIKNESKSIIVSLGNKVMFREESRMEAIKDYNKSCGE
jgi:hypothetical protein